MNLADKPKASKRKFWDQADLIHARFPPRVWVINDLMAEKTVNFIWGKEKVGKTYMLLQLIKCFITQEDFLQYKIPKRRKVLYYCLELKEEDYQERCRTTN